MCLNKELPVTRIPDQAETVFRDLNLNIKGYGNIFPIGVLPRAIEITLKSAVKPLVACLVSEILKDKHITKRLDIRDLGYSKTP
mgnify:CR=1 FL=1